jgi:riboflavin kinase/FMN adenylyltransferase
MAKVIHLDENTRFRFRKPFVTWGVFDGVHVGHQRVIGMLVEWAKREHAEAVVLTFDAHPRTVLGNTPVPLVVGVEKRVELISALGADAVVVVPFTRRFAAMSAKGFLEKLLVERIGAAGVVLGFDARFGRGRGGSVSMLKDVCTRRGIECHQAKPILVDGKPVSSTLIRETVTAGRLDMAELMLGRPFILSGKVVHGDTRGRRIGFPTANVEIAGTVRPPAGVYGACVRWEGSAKYALVSVGTRPTFAKGPGPDPEVIEAHLLDFGGNLYDKTMEVEFLNTLRAQKTFASVQALIEQISADKRAFERWLNHAGGAPACKPAGTGCPRHGAC